MDREWRTRVQEFVDWAVGSGIDANRLPHYRRFGADLISRASGGRVTESHILALHDALEASPEGASLLATVEEVGDAMLRFQEHLRSLGRPVGARALTPVPIAPLGASPSSTADFHEAPAPSPAQAGHSIKENGPAAEPPRPLKPARRPSSLVDGLNETEVVSFSPVEPGRRDPAPSTARGTMPPSPSPVAASAAGSSPPRPTRSTLPPVTTAQQFRCPKCHVMVTPTDAGLCPKCGAAPPHILAAPAARADSSPRISTTRILLILAAIAVALFAVTRVVPLITDRNPSGTRRVSGDHRAEHLGVHVMFPKGWHQIVADDAIYGDLSGIPYHGLDDTLGFDPKALQVYNLSQLRLSTYYRGKAPPGHDAGLILGVGVAAGPPGWRADLDTADAFASFGASLLGKALPAAGIFHAPKCGSVGLPSTTGRCLTALDPGYLVSYFWVLSSEPSTYGIAILYVPRGSPEDAMLMGDSIVASVLPL